MTGSSELGIGGIVLLTAGITGNLVFGASTLALPALEAGLALSTSTGTLVVALYSVGFAASLVLGGRLGDARGRRRVLRLALAALIPASLVVAIAPGAALLLFGRAAQGIASGLALPQVLSTIQHTTSGRSRARWTGAYAAVIGGGTAVGQLGAGLLVSADPFGAGWRLSYAMVAAVAGLALAVSRAVPETRSNTTTRLDPMGALLLGAAIAVLVLPLGLGSSLRPQITLVLVALSLVLFALFAAWERRRTARDALIPTAALRVDALRVGLALTLLFFAGYGGFVYYFPTTLQAGLGLGALTASIVLMPFAAGFVVTSALLPLLLVRSAGRRVMRMGVAAQIVLLGSVAAVVAGGGTQPPLCLLCGLLVGLGAAQAAMYGPLIGSVMGALAPGLAGLASGLFSTLQQVGIALGVPLFGLVLESLPAAPSVTFAACVGVQILISVLFALLVGRIGGAKQTR